MPSAGHRDALRDVGARVAVALTIAGSDSSGGAGIQADLKTFAALGVYGASAITALTAQNTLGVQAVSAVDAAFVVRQIDSVLADLDVAAIKTGMLGTAAVVLAVAERLAAAADIPLVVDPVMVSTSGHLLLADEAIAACRARLLPLVALVTPNIPEAARLLGEPEARTVEDAVRQAQSLVARGCRAVLVKGGHGDGPGNELVDVLCDADGIVLHRHARVATANTHGTGCTLSAAIAARLALGAPLRAAVADGIAYVTAALAAGAGRRIGGGHGPVDHFFALPGRGR